ncbi:uncharacterized protein BX663DRAFT_505095 [Cokeromyces recurvatus]|uniref:uncharacterized protein n=1 Tax=Cokeromyces recurvatus TaxID=90255 RepID=UPI0022207CF5|nr:uncharacterized protein BX663DRAFT_505095 [Cokeromyces recurvatus]KAI7904453.1 hypothetical protein BX663DRAFT_505095 [Cokeromyces recurvatus]
MQKSIILVEYEKPNNNSTKFPSQLENMKHKTECIYSSFNKDNNSSFSEKIEVTDNSLQSSITIQQRDNIENKEIIHIPKRHQSYLYNPIINVDKMNYLERKAYCTNQASSFVDNSIITSSLLSTKTMASLPNASSTVSHHQKNDNSQLQQPVLLPNKNITIPTRRTSKNYSKDPEIQAKLNALILNNTSRKRDLVIRMDGCLKKEEEGGSDSYIL